MTAQYAGDRRDGLGCRVEMTTDSLTLRETSANQHVSPAVRW
jgi:hypothetical protein